MATRLEVEPGLSTGAPPQVRAPSAVMPRSSLKRSPLRRLPRLAPWPNGMVMGRERVHWRADPAQPRAAGGLGVAPFPIGTRKRALLMVDAHG